MSTTRDEFAAAVDAWVDGILSHVEAISADAEAFAVWCMSCDPPARGLAEAIAEFRRVFADAATPACEDARVVMHEKISAAFGA